jgi:hypothetical protein
MMFDSAGVKPSNLNFAIANYRPIVDIRGVDPLQVNRGICGGLSEHIVRFMRMHLEIGCSRRNTSGFNLCICF